MRRDRERDIAILAEDVWPPLTAQERRDVEHETEPRQDWPTRQEARQDARKLDLDWETDDLGYIILPGWFGGPRRIRREDL